MGARNHVTICCLFFMVVVVVEITELYLVQPGHFLVATGYVAPSPNHVKHNVSEVRMYLIVGCETRVNDDTFIISMVVMSRVFVISLFCWIPVSPFGVRLSGDVAATTRHNNSTIFGEK